MERFKQFIKSPLGIIMGIAFLAVVAYLLIKRNSGVIAPTAASTTTTDATGDTTTSGLPGAPGGGDDNPPQPPLGWPGPPGPVGPPGPPGPGTPPTTNPTPPAQKPPAPVPPQPVTPPSPTPPPTGGTWTRPYLVKSGDTLGAIASRAHTTAQEVYNHNKATIDAMALAHHYPAGPNPMNNIFPGEPLVLPQ